MMQKMGDDLFSSKKEVNQTEEKQVSVKVKENIKSDDLNTKEKINHMDLFGEFNAKSKERSKSRRKADSLNKSNSLSESKTSKPIRNGKGQDISKESNRKLSDNPIIKNLDNDLPDVSFTSGFDFEADEITVPKSPEPLTKSDVSDHSAKPKTAEPLTKPAESASLAKPKKSKDTTKKHNPDVSMRTRESAIGDYIDKIKEKQPALNVGDKLNRAKEEVGDNVTIEDKLYSNLENGCNITLDFLEGAGENLASRLKRSAVSVFSSFQNKMMKKKFKRNDNIIQYGDFMFYEMNDELMLYKYVGIDTKIKIPSYVEDMPVCYLEKNFLKFNGIKSVGRGLSIEKIQDVSMESIKDNFFNIKSIQLPNTLKIIPSKVFSGCNRIDELVIPESVTLVQPNAFVGCRPSKIIFLGKAPKQLQDANLAKVKVFCKKEYFNSFFKLMRNYDDYISNQDVKKKYFSLRKKIVGNKDTAIWDRMKRATDLREEIITEN